MTYNETKTIDFAVCPVCESHFNPGDLLGTLDKFYGGSANMDCPDCGAKLEVLISIEYVCQLEAQDEI